MQDHENRLACYDDVTRQASLPSPQIPCRMSFGELLGAQRSDQPAMRQLRKDDSARSETRSNRRPFDVKMPRSPDIHARNRFNPGADPLSGADHPCLASLRRSAAKGLARPSRPCSYLPCSTAFLQLRCESDAVRADAVMLDEAAGSPLSAFWLRSVSTDVEHPIGAYTALMK